MLFNGMDTMVTVVTAGLSLDAIFFSFPVADRKYPTDLSALLLGDLYYTRLALGGLSEHRTHNALLEVYQILHANVSSNIAKVTSGSRK